MAPSRPQVTAAVCAYNEAGSIGQLLETLLERDAGSFDELIAVSSGSSDGTDEIIAGFAARYPKLVAVREPERRGKASAVNEALARASGELVLLIDGDCLPAEGCLQALLACFQDERVGGAGSRNVVVNGDAGVVARASAAMWEMHHKVCLSRPVLGGDIIAFRRVVESIPAGAVNDDYVIEAALRSRGYRIAYAAEARVLMRAPETARDFLRQRRRIHAGFRAETRRGLVKATQDPRLAARAAFDLVRREPRRAAAVAALLALELAARVSVVADALAGRSAYYSAWEPAPTTKGRLPEYDSRERAP
ncbi:MAG TPA: glycosyltransferase [Dehalococcoidia bacterium]|nr:glycosyltransferase [Dehalococcoidia bacterium]